jgi:hypothetical protein
MGSRAGQAGMWTNQQSFLARARAQGAAIFSLLRNQPFMRPFNWKRGTSLFDGVFHWRRAGHEARRAARPHADAAKRAELRWGSTANKPTRARRSRRPP